MKRAVQDLFPFIHLMTSTGGRQMAAGVLLAVAAALSGMALLGLSGWFITATAIAGLSVATAVMFDVFAPSAGIRLLALSRTAARYGERLATHDATFRVLAALRERLFRGWAERPVARQLMLRPSKLLFRLTQDVDALESIYLRLVVPVAVAGCAALAMSVALSLMHPFFGAAAGLFLLVAGLGVPLIAVSAAARISHRRVRSVEKLRARTIDLVSGQTDLIMTGRLAAQRDAIVRADRRIADADMSLSRTESWLVIGFGTIGAMLLSCVLLAASVLVERGTVGPPVAALAVLIALGAMEPFAALRRSVLAFGGMLLAARRIRARQAAGNAEPACEQPRAGFAVACSGVTVRYPCATYSTLRHIDFTIRQGERVALVGPSGSGKSTLMALLAGDIDAASGHVAHVGSTLFTQRTELFQDSLRDNMRLADPAADDVRLLRAIDAAGLSSHVASLPEGLEAVFGEGGLGLSGGEARRLALARLFLRDTPMWLLDEPTEGLDGPTARDVLQRLSAQADGKTLVIATHLRREAEHADRLLVLGDGCIVADVTRAHENFKKILGKLRPD